MTIATRSAKPRKNKICKVCSTEFTPIRAMQKVCCGKCALELARTDRATKKAAEDALKLKIRKRELRPLSHWMVLTQRAFNDYIRARDADQPCISCGTLTASRWDAGHYRTTAAAKQLRFNQDNCHKQCSQCNTHHSGNIGPYRIALVNKIGADRVLALETNNETRRYTREELDEIRKLYRAKLKTLISK